MSGLFVKALIKIGKFILSFVISISVLSILYLVTNNNFTVRIPNPEGTTEERAYPNQIITNMEEGFTYCKFDEKGFYNTYPAKKKDIDILLVGSSQMEGIHVSSDKNTGYLLNQLFPKYYTYNIGISGMYLPQNINYIGNAYKYFSPQKYVLIGTNHVCLNSSELESVYNNSYKTRKRLLTKGGYKNFVPPALRYTFAKIKDKARLWRSKSKDYFAKSKKSANQASNQDSISILNKYFEILNKFLAFARSKVPENITLIIFYYPSVNVDRNANLLINQYEKDYVNGFEKACQNNNIIFVNLSQDFENLYKEKHVLPYGFVNTRPGGGHLNDYGHQVISNKLAEIIKSLEKGKM